MKRLRLRQTPPELVERQEHRIWYVCGWAVDVVDGEETVTLVQDTTINVRDRGDEGGFYTIKMFSLDGSEISSEPIFAYGDGSIRRDNCTDLEFYGAFEVDYQLIRSWEEGYAVITTNLDLDVKALYQTDTWASGADTTLTSAVDVEYITPRTVLVPALLTD